MILNKCRILLIFFFIVLFFMGCSNDEPLKIGFVGGLTGRFANLGVDARNGVTLAIEEINKKGGIHGRKVVLLTRDDKQNEQTAARVDKELIEHGVFGIVGHMTSSMSVVGRKIATKHKVVMISPTASSSDLTGIDDHFFRIYPATSSDSAMRIANYSYKRGFKRVGIIYDYGNKAHTVPSLKFFKAIFKKLGGEVVFEQRYRSRKETDFIKFAKKCVDEKIDALYLLANAMDTAIICQHIAKMGGRIPVLGTEWSATKEIFQFGGKAVEVLVFSSSFNISLNSSHFKEFSRAFQKRFGYSVNFASSNGYDCASILFTAFKKSRAQYGLKEAIIDIGIFKGVQGELSLNQYGDVKRDYYLMTIKDGKFSAVE